MILLRIYRKGADTKHEAPLFEGTSLDAGTATITGLQPGTAIEAGEYIALNHDDSGKYADSDPVDLPAFTVEENKAPQPNVKVEPTTDGAKVTEAE